MMTDTETVTAEHTVLSTRLGDLTIVRDDDHLTGLYFPHHWHMPDPVTFGSRNDRGFEDVASQLEEYLAGTRTFFDLPIEARGTGCERPGGRCRSEPQSAVHPDPLPQGHRKHWEADRLCRRPEAQAGAPGARAAGMTRVLRALWQACAAICWP